MNASFLRYDVLLFVQLLGAVILVASLFHSGLTVFTIFGGLLVLFAVAGLAIAAVLDERKPVPTSTRENGRLTLGRRFKR